MYMGMHIDLRKTCNAKVQVCIHDVCRHVHGHVCTDRYVRRHVYRCMYRYMYRYMYRHVYRYMYRYVH